VAGNDPTEKLRQWTGALFLIGLAALDIPAIGWEIFVRHGTDPGVFSAAFVITSIILVGPLGIRIVRRNGNGDS
jgi:hypothetical protein